MTIRRTAWLHVEGEEPDRLLQREWLVANGLGGYASGTLAGICTRRYHGLLIAALPAPLGRVVVLNHLAEEVRSDGSTFRLGGDELDEGRAQMEGRLLAEFHLETGLPVWRYHVGEAVLEKRLVMPRLQNTVYVIYKLIGGSGHVRLRLRPSVHFRGHGGRVDAPLDTPYDVRSFGDRYSIHADPHPPLHLATEGADVKLVLDGGRFRQIYYRVEARRGYDARGTLWSPGYFKVDMAPGQEVALVGSVESWDMIRAMRSRDAYEAELGRRRRLLELAHPEARRGFGAELVLAADSFLVTPATRPRENARIQAAGDDAVTMIAGYHWFTDWGRDTMISLEGLALLTGRQREAAGIINTFSHYIRGGLIPNHFPEAQQDAIYNTADATLWYFHAIDVYVRLTKDRLCLRTLLRKLQDIVAKHLRGTDFGIGVDPKDGLIRQGADGLALTWMDARMEDWVVTPRRGKAVEINALWYNALRLMERWLAEEGEPMESRAMGDLAARVRDSFNARFWNPAAGHLFDVVDGEKGDDPALRPNQIFAISLPHPVLDPSRWEAVVESVRRDLLTPVGLRSLAPSHPDYKSKYSGDLRLRDGAYHQGTVWSWLIGPFIDAWMRTHPEDRAGARKLLAGFPSHLGEACVGSISEIFDAEAPFAPRGCVSQAWGVAEVLRAWIATSPETLEKPSGEQARNLEVR